MMSISRAKELKQAEIDKRMGVKTPTGTNGSGDDDKKSKLDWLKKRSKIEWSIALALADTIVFFWKIYTPGLHLTQVGDWSMDHWISLGVFFGILFTIVALNAQVLGKAANVLRWMLAGTLFMLFIGFPMWFGIAEWYNTPSSDSHSERVFKVPANSDSVHVYPNGNRVTFRGSNDFSTHCVYSDGRPEGIVGDSVHPCENGPMMYVYVHNNTGKEISLVCALHK